MSSVGGNNLLNDEQFERITQILQTYEAESIAQALGIMEIDLPPESVEIELKRYNFGYCGGCGGWAYDIFDDYCEVCQEENEGI